MAKRRCVMREYLMTSKALADESRVRILKLLEQGEMCVCQIMAVIGLKQSTISKHLSILKTAGLAEDRKDGIWAYNRLAQERVNPYALAMLDSLRTWLNDDKTVLADRTKWDEVKKIDINILCKK
jgi:ArsR family transcriptional regulator